jgi:hypothetical protein
MLFVLYDGSAGSHMKCSERIYRERREERERKRENQGPMEMKQGPMDSS